MLNAASAALDAGDLAQAESLCRMLLQAQPGNGGAQLLLARRLVGDFDEAATLAEAASRQMPKEPAARFEAALAHGAAGRYMQAESAARKGLRLRPTSAAALQVLAEVLARAGKLSESLEI